jgi:hypothetical protein
MSAPEIEKRIVNITERATSQTVTGVDHIESNSFAGIGLIKVMAVRQLSGEPGVIHRIPGFPQSRFIDGDNRTSQVAGDPLRTCRARVHVPPSTGH